MTDRRWPDPERPGFPLNPEQDGWHWLLSTSGAILEPWFYAADRAAWFDRGRRAHVCDRDGVIGWSYDGMECDDEVTASWRYHALCLPPDRTGWRPISELVLDGRPIWIWKPGHPVMEREAKEVNSIYIYDMGWAYFHERQERPAPPVTTP